MSDLTGSLNRLARNMTITQVALHTQPPVAMFRLNLEALLSSVKGAMDALDEEPDNQRCVVNSPLGKHTAELLASALNSEPIPDTIPDEWKDGP